MTLEARRARGDWMMTHTGRQFFPMAPQADDVEPFDIAHALSMQCRYNGHVDRFYSVAEHCVLMSRYFADDRHALWALLHDAAEAYVGDMVRPLKRSMPDYRRAEDAVMVEIALRFNIADWSGPHGAPVATVPDEVLRADSRILLTERAALFSAPSPAPWAVEHLEPLPVTIEGWAPAVAEAQYLERLRELGALA